MTIAVLRTQTPATRCIHNSERALVNTLGAGLGLQALYASPESAETKLPPAVVAEWDEPLASASIGQQAKIVSRLELTPLDRRQSHLIECVGRLSSPRAAAYDRKIEDLKVVDAAHPAAAVRDEVRE
eukprot:scaffold124097_cov105-Phaeocystis_antarctica.AAC.3